MDNKNITLTLTDDFKDFLNDKSVIVGVEIKRKEKITGMKFSRSDNEYLNYENRPIVEDDIYSDTNEGNLFTLLENLYFSVGDEIIFKYGQISKKFNSLSEDKKLTTIKYVVPKLSGLVMDDNELFKNGFKLNTNDDIKFTL
jgi:hypothetical protein